MTICSYDNSGQLKFDVDIEMEQGYWNTSSSRLWTRIRDLMHNDIVTTYNNMRQNGVSYENMMHYIYDEQIAKISQTYYNKDYDVKYAPFADSYIGMAHGDTYEHVKRWLKQRFTFVDTLFDYAPSYNNDVLTIRANTTELMTLEIETYTPVYQHLSWYNGQMDKKKIDGKVSVEFSGTAQAATDQEVLIYGGSNVKSIKGITSMNPNRMLIGSATKLVEIDAHDCPLLADINANKANLSPHEYLNKVNLSNCPLLEGNLKLNNSPLVQELDIRGTNITGMNLPGSIRNLQVLRLPNTMTELTLNDANMLHTLEFDEGVNLQSISMTNCNALENVTGFDLLQTPSITLNNSYNTVAELYFRDTTNLSLNNMPNLERVIFTPNNEYETFEMINVANAPDYKVTTFNCPKLSTFMTTAPYRESYNNCGMTDKIIIKPGNAIEILPTKLDLNIGYYVNANSGEVATLNNDVTACSTYIPITEEVDYTFKSSVSGRKVQIVFYKDDMSYICIENESYIGNQPLPFTFTAPKGYKYLRFHIVGQNVNQSELSLINYPSVLVKDYGDIQPNTTFTANSIDISSTQFTDVKLLCATDTNTLKLPTTVKNFYCDSSFDLDTDHLEDGEYDVVHGELVEPYTTDYEGEVLYQRDIEQYYPMTNVDIFTDIIPIINGTDVIVIPIDGAIGYTCYVRHYANYDNAMSNNPSQEREFRGVESGKPIIIKSTRPYIRLHLPTRYASYKVIYKSEPVTPNLIPSSADGSLIFSMYAPNNTVAPTSGTWDLKGLKFDNFHTFGMNNDVKVIIEKTQNINFNEVIELANVEFDLNIKLSASAINRGYIRLCDGSKMRMIYFNRQYIAYATDIDSWVFTKLKEDTSSSATKLKLSVSQGILTYYLDDVLFYSTYLNNIPYYNDTIYNKISIELVNDGGFDSIISSKTLTSPSNDINDINSLSMPARYDDYNITIKNANISPKTHNTMLYPLLVNEDKPITGTLDYTNYEGKYLSWSFAYTDEDYVNIIQPKDELINSYEHKYNAFYDTEYEFDNPYEIARYTSSASGVLPSFNSEFDYTYDEIDNGDGTYTTKIYADSLDNLPIWLSYNNKTNLLSVEKLKTGVLVSAESMFQGCSSLTSVNISEIDVSSVGQIYRMFRGCIKLTEIKGIANLSNGNFTNTWEMFLGCGSLTELDVSGFNTNNVTSMDGMFRGCSGLTSLDLSGFDTGKVTTMANMFYDCNNLTSLDLSGFDTGKVTLMHSMFRGCSKLTSLDLSGFDTGKVTNMDNMFNGCSGLTSIDLSEFDTSNVTNMESMFYNCWSLKEVKGIENWDCSKVDKFGSMFQGATAFGGDLDLRNWKVGQNATVTSIYSFMNGCTNLKSVDMSGWILPDNTNFSNFMNNQGSLHTVKVIGWSAVNIQNICGAIGFYVRGTIYGDIIIDESKLPSGWVYDNVMVIAKYTANATGVLPAFNTDFTGYTTGETDNGDGTYTVSIATDSLDNLPTKINFTANNNLLTVDKLNTSKVTTMLQMFRSCGNLTRINCRLDTSGVINEITQAFIDCRKLEYLDMTGFVNSNIKYAVSLFQDCQTITHIDGLDTWDISSITDFSNMFANCYALSDLTAVENWDMSNAKVLDTMFARCNAIESFDLTKWDVSNVTNMRYMFGWARGPVSIDMTGWDTSNVENMYYMFGFCNKLTEIKGLENFNTAKVTNMQYMLCEYQATELDLSGWDVSSVTNMSYLFDSCPNLQSLNLSGWGTSNVIYMNNMFNNCSSLTTITGLSDLDTSNVTTMAKMFDGCSKLTSLDLSTFDTSNVTSMSSMFSSCQALTELIGLSNWNTSALIDISYAFQKIPLTNLDLGGWDLTNCTTARDAWNFMYNLDSIVFPNNLSVSFGIGQSFNLTADNVVEIFNKLATVTTTQTASIGANLLKKLTEEQIVIATNKGWTVA